MAAKTTQAGYIAKAKRKHGERYDYSKVVYTGDRRKVDIICRVHGVFSQAAGNHIAGTHCAKCQFIRRGRDNAKKYAKGKAYFVERARAVHGDFYDYSITEYKSIKAKVTIICPKHGAFTTTAVTHLAGKRCAKCGDIAGGRKNRKTQDEFIEQANAIHGNAYDYSAAVYALGARKIKIICAKHGEFLQTARKHLEGHGCPHCTTYGILNKTNAVVYVMAYSEGITKIGISSDVQRRLKELQRHAPQIDLIAAFACGSGRDAYKIEQALHARLAARRVSRAAANNGDSELFHISPARACELIQEQREIEQ